MAVLEILTAPHPFLKTKAQPVADVTAEHRQLMDDMVETMRASDGIGLAAIQVGRTERIIVVDVAPHYKERDETPPPLYQMANPEVIWTSEEETTFLEGCLSVPDQFDEVSRPARARIRYLDRDGNPQEIDADGILATCVQHEIDHLNGILFVDHLSSVKRSMILRKLKKAKRARETEAA